MRIGNAAGNCGKWIDIWRRAFHDEDKVAALCGSKQRPERAIMRSQATRERVPLNQGNFKGRTALVVDDMDAVRELVQEILQRLGFAVHTAGNGKEAVQVAKERGEEIDVLISDLEMPDMHGFEVADEISRMVPGVEVVYMSGTLTPEQWRAVGGGPGTPFLAKPFGIREVSEVMRGIFTRPK